MRLNVLIFCEGLKSQNVICSFLFSMKHSYILIPLGYSNTTLERYIKSYTPMEHPIILQKMTLTMFRSLF